MRGSGCGAQEFSRLEGVLDECGVKRVDEFLMDLGVSSPQLDQAQRADFRSPRRSAGHAHGHHAGQTAAGFRHGNGSEIGEVIRTMGKKRFAVQIAQAIAARRAEGQSLQPANLPPSWRTSSARANVGRSRGRIQRPAPFRLYGLTSIGNLRNCRPDGQAMARLASAAGWR